MKEINIKNIMDHLEINASMIVGDMVRNLKSGEFKAAQANAEHFDFIDDMTSFFLERSNYNIKFTDLND